jgi:hypothetical protein
VIENMRHLLFLVLLGVFSIDRSIAQQTSVVFNELKTNALDSCARHTDCVALHECPIGQFASLDHPVECVRSNQGQGICCPKPMNEQSVSVAAHSPALIDQEPVVTLRGSTPRISATALHNAESKARSAWSNTHSLERKIEHGHGFATGAEETHTDFFGTNPTVNHLTHRGELLINMALDLAER